jgi:hypothetical protein
MNSRMKMKQGRKCTEQKRNEQMRTETERKCSQRNSRMQKHLAGTQREEWHPAHSRPTAETLEACMHSRQNRGRHPEGKQQNRQVTNTQRTEAGAGNT